MHENTAYQRQGEDAVLSFAIRAHSTFQRNTCRSQRKPASTKSRGRYYTTIVGGRPAPRTAQAQRSKGVQRAERERREDARLGVKQITLAESFSRAVKFSFSIGSAAGAFIDLTEPEIIDLTQEEGGAVEVIDLT